MDDLIRSKTYLRPILKLLLLISFPVLGNANEMKPIFDLNGSVREIPLIWQVMVEPAGFKTEELTGKKAATLRKSVHARVDEVIKSNEKFDKKQQLQLLQDLYSLIHHGGIRAHISPGILQAMLREAASYAQVARRFSELAKDQSDAKVFKYHSYVGRLLTKENDADVISKLLKLRPALPAAYKDPIDLASYIQLTFSSYTAAQGLADLNKARSNLKGASLIVCDLAMGRALAGLDARGEKIRGASPKYGKKLASALELSRTLGSETRSAAVNYAYGVWRRVAGKKITSPPFLVRYLETPGDAAVKEREVLVEVSQGNIQNALRFYKAVLKPFSNSPYGISLVNRSLELEEMRYAKSKSAQRYYQALVELQPLVDEWTKGRRKNASALAKSLEKRRDQLILSHLKLANQEKASQGVRREAIRLAEVELKKSTKPSDRAIKSLLAKVFTKEKQFHKAESLLNEMAIGGSSSDIKTLMELAKSQRALAGWPELPPWTKMPATGLEQRRKLLETYAKLAQQLKKANVASRLFWNIQGQLILLQLSFGSRSDAIASLTQGIELHPQGKQASFAAGTLIRTLYQDKVWPALAKVLTKVEQYKIKPALLGPESQFLRIRRDVAYEMSRRAPKQKRGRYYLDFVENEAKGEIDPRAKEIYWNLARYYLAQKKPKASLKVIEQYLVRNKGSAVRGPFLLEGHNIAYAHKLDESAAAFGLLYLRKNRGKEAVQVRGQLINVMERKKAYKMLAKLSEEQARDPRVSSLERTKAATKALMIYQKLKKEVKADAMASYMEKEMPQNPRSVALAIEHFARKSSHTRNRVRLGQLAQKLSKYSAKIPEVASAKGFIRFQLAELNLPSRPTSVKGDPQMVLKKTMDQFAKVWQVYDQICQGDVTPYCGPAKYRLAVFTEKVINKLETMPLPGHLSQTAINNINLMRDREVAKLKGLIDQSLRVAFRLAKEGNTPFAWRGPIMAGHDRYRGTGVIGVR